LFKDKLDVYKKFITDILDALKGLSEKEPKTLEARKVYSLTLSDFNQLVNDDSLKWWRFKYVYGGPTFIYFIAFLSAILAVWFLFSPTLTSYTILWVPASAFLWGAVGGLLWGFWRLWQHSCSREIRKAWYNWYIALPLIGAILGAMTYLLLLSGLLAITGEVNVQSQYLPLLLSGLAGFSAKWAVQGLENVTKKVQ